MEIPYTVTPRPDTGLTNPKLGIWLFLASEVMLFGGLFSGYLFLRLGAEDGYWPHGLLNVPIGTFNTAVLIASSVTVVLAWAALKMRKFKEYKLFMLMTIVCGAAFLFIKLTFEYPEKFQHFGAYIKKDSMAKYDDWLGNDFLKTKGRSPRVEISGHLHAVEVEVNGQHEHWHDGKEFKSPGHLEKVLKEKKAKVTTFEVAVDPVNANPRSEEEMRPHFFHKKNTDKIAKIDAADVQWASSFAPKHSPYFAIYFTITGLHGLHVLAGVLVFLYFWGPGAALYKTNPEQLCNRVEVAGLFWHFVDLVWIFVFPIFYLL